MVGDWSSDVCSSDLAQGFAVARAGEDHVFHPGAAQRFGGLLAQNPGDGVGDVGLAAAVGSYDGRDAFAGELDLSAITEGLEAEDLNLLELEQMRPLWAEGWGDLAYWYDCNNFSCVLG